MSWSWSSGSPSWRGGSRHWSGRTPGPPPGRRRLLGVGRAETAARRGRGGRCRRGVLYTGSVRLPTGESYEWQYGALTEALVDGDWADAAESFAALGHPVRLRLLREILGGLRTAAELAALDEAGTTGQIYHHLRQLTGAGWLHAAGRGRYEIPPVRVVPLLVVLTAARP